MSCLSLFMRTYCHVERTDPALVKEHGSDRMPILYACVILDMFRRIALPPTTTIASLAALQSAIYHV
jgi:hypothetical protein